MADFTIKQNDTRPKMTRSLSETINGASAPLNLTSASAVKLISRFSGSLVAKINASAGIASALGGVVQYTFTSTNTDVVGLMDAEWEVTWNDGGVETVPNSGYFSIEVVDDLG